MPRTARAAEGGYVYHVMNRGNNRGKIFRKDADYIEFIELLTEARDRAKIEVLGFCLMPDHWHLVLRPKGDTDLASYLAWITNTHAKRFPARNPSTSGHLYEGRYKSFPVQKDESCLLTLLQFVESNPRRAKLVPRAERWQWSSLGMPDSDEKTKLLSGNLGERPKDWLVRVNEPMTPAELESLHACVIRGRPLGSDVWVRKTAARLNLEYTLRPRGRPRKVVPAKKPGKAKLIKAS